MNVTQIVAGERFHCALDAAGTVSCWELTDCGPLPASLSIEQLVHTHGPVKRMFASGYTLCLTPAKGPTQCHRPATPRFPPPWTAPADIQAITGGGCTLLANGTVRCNLGSPGNNYPAVGRVVFPGVFDDVAEGGFNPGYHGVQHCAITKKEKAVVCCTLMDCKKHKFQRSTFPSPAVQLVGANSFVAARLMNGDVYAWRSTVRHARVPFAVDPSGKVTTLSNTVEIAGGGHNLCARLRDGTVACVGHDFGNEDRTVIRVRKQSRLPE